MGSSSAPRIMHKIGTMVLSDMFEDHIPSTVFAKIGFRFGKARVLLSSAPLVARTPALPKSTGGRKLVMGKFLLRSTDFSNGCTSI